MAHRPTDEIGTVTVERIFVDENGNATFRIRITRADRRVRIGSVFIDAIRNGDIGWPHFHLNGDVFTIRDDYGQRFIYRIRWDDYADGGYLAEWPD